VYLLSFILTFESDRWYRRWFWGPMLVLTTFWSFYIWRYLVDLPLATQITSQLLLLFSMAMICHGELARLRPSADRLTAYYLSISGGGALGGAFVALVAPLLFSDYYEYPLVVIVVWMLALVILVADRSSPFYDGRNFRWVLPMGALFLGVVAGVINFVYGREINSVARARNFYGALRVREFAGDESNAGYRQLANGRISHGAEFLDPKVRRYPSQYYGPTTGAGQLLPDNGGPPRRVGVVGLGVGTLAAYALKGDDYIFYDINPQVVDFAEERFHFLSDARERGANVEIVLGDARLQLEREPDQQFDVLILDAFTSDAIPSHLLTLEAFKVYLRHLKNPDGVIAAHISNRYLNLAIVVTAAARRLGLETRLVYSLHDGSPMGSEAAWILAFRPEAAVAKLNLGVGLAKTGPQIPDVLWTDDYTNVLDVILKVKLDAMAGL
jgi:SAM-dependent methyltransferase